jgi:hypothetical protein
MKDKLPECPVCWGSNTKIIKPNPFGRNTFAMGCDGCGEESGWFDTKEKAIACWAKAEEKRKALTPKLSEKSPDSEGLWWWWNGNKEDKPAGCIVEKWCGELWANVAGANNSRVADMSGYWAKVQMPEMPEGEDG